MKVNSSVIKLCQFELDEKRQKVADIISMIEDFASMAKDLDRQIRMEEEKCGISDINHFSYPPFAKAAVQRRDNLLASIAELKAQLVKSRQELAEAEEELEKLSAASMKKSGEPHKSSAKRKTGKKISPARQLQMAGR